MALVDSIPYISGHCDQSGCGLSSKLDVAGSFPALTEKGFLGLVSSTQGLEAKFVPVVEIPPYYEVDSHN